MLNNVCLNRLSLCALLEQSCHLPSFFLTHYDFQLNLSNYMTYFQLYDENHQHHHPLFIFDGSLLCVSTANEL